MKYYNRNKKEMIFEKDKKLLSFLYNNFLGRIILKPLTLRPISVINGKLLSTRISTIAIKNFIKKNNINMDDYPNIKYKSFNDFFTRKIKKDKRPIDSNKEMLISIADSKLMAYDINKDLLINVKNSTYTLQELVQDDNLKEYEEGKLLVFRLSVDDYHHYNFIDNGTIISSKKISGKFHTVNPIAYDKVKVWKENQRVVSHIKTENFGNIIQIEVGALNVGTIHNNDKKNFKRAEEKGYFSFGGSTIIVIFEKNKIKLDSDILKNSSSDIETRVLMNETIGRKY